MRKRSDIQDLTPVAEKSRDMGFSISFLEQLLQLEENLWENPGDIDAISHFVKKEVQIDFAVPDNFEPSVGIVIKSGDK